MNHTQKSTSIRKIIPRFLSIVLQVTLWLALAATSVFAAVPTIFKVIIQKSDGTGTNKIAVQFTEAVYGNIAHTSALSAGNFTFYGSASSTTTISAVEHLPGSDTAILTLSAVSVPAVATSGILSIDGTDGIRSLDAQFAPGSAVDLADPVSAVTDAVSPIMSAVFTVNNVSQPNTVTVSFDEALGDKKTVETVTNWTLTGLNASPSYPISSVALSADRKNVTLTLPPVDSANPATYITNANAAAHLQVTPSANIVDLVGNPLSGGLVNGLNEILVLDNTPPTVSSTLSMISGTQFMLSFSEKMAADANNYINYTVGGTGGGNSVSIAQLQPNGADVILTLASAISTTAGQTLTVTATAIADLAGNTIVNNNMATFTAGADVLPPVLSSAIVTGASLVLIYSDVNGLDGASIPSPSDFSVIVNGSPATVTGVAVNSAARIVVLTLQDPVARGVPVTLSYAPGINRIRDAAAIQAAPLTAQMVTNNSSAPALFPINTTVGKGYGYPLYTFSLPDGGGQTLSSVTAVIDSTGVSPSAVASDFASVGLYAMSLNNGMLSGPLVGVSQTTIAVNKAPMTINAGNVAVDPSKIYAVMVWIASAPVDGHKFTADLPANAITLGSGALTNAAVSGTTSITIDASDPVITATPSNIGETGAIFTVTSSEQGYGSYVVLPANAAAPTALQVYYGQDANGVLAGIQDKFSLPQAAIPFNINITRLAPGTSYKLYLVASDTASNRSALVTQTFTTASPPAIYNVSAPPPPPPPPPPLPTPSGPTTPVTTPGQVINNPPPNVTVDPSGAIVIAAPVEPTAAPIVISPTATENALVKLPTNRPITITADKTTLTYTDKQGGSQLVVRTVDGQPQLEIANGVIAIASTTPGSVIPVISVDLKSVGTVTTSTDSDSVVVVKNDKSAVVFVDTGKVDYKGPNQDAQGVSVYSGENAKLNNTNGQLDQITLGSHNGENQVPGDPLPQQPGYAADTHVPKLDGNLPRFNNSVSLLDILHDAIQQVLGDAGGQISYDKNTGVVSYIIGDHGYRLIPLGEIQVLLNQLSAASVTATAGGAFNLASRGIQMSLSGAVGYFSDLNQVVKTLDANGAITLKPSGTMEMSVNGKRYAGIPGVAASLPAAPTPIPGFEVDGGLAVFRDHLGVLQTLYPAALEMDSVAAALKAVDPGGNLTNNGNGTLTATIAGRTYLFLPDYQVIALPDNRSAEAWWAEGNVIYIRNSDNSAQGFRLQ